MQPSDVKAMIGRAFAGVRQALRGKVIRANAAKRVILIQGDGVAGEKFNSTEFFQHPGLRSVPIDGMQTVVVPLNGKSAAGVVVACSNGTLFVTDLQAGEVALFNENDGVANSLILRNGKLAELTTDTFKIKATTLVDIDTPLVKMSHNLEVAENTKTDTINVTSTAADASQMAGGLKAAKDIVAGTVSLQNHITTGVQSGSSLSGKPQQ
ncbi:phage baseplate assembly protein V [Paucimonas lemoignei]|nr:phage baseplate assembly protein V [Paucimonas lemoignei]